MHMTVGGADRNQGRSMVISRYGIVAAESPLAAQAGAQILEHGGNAIDAAVAANAMMGLVAPMMDGMGGDLFAIVYDAKSGKLYGLNASGWAPAGLSIQFLKDQGIREMPQHGIQSVTVPGAVDGWQKLLDRFGKKKFPEVLAPAIRAAEDGFPVPEWMAAAWKDGADSLRASDAAVQTYLPSGRAPATGQLFRNPDLARSLRLVAQGGRDAYYKREIAKISSKPRAATAARWPKKISRNIPPNGSIPSPPPIAVGRSTSFRRTARGLPH